MKNNILCMVAMWVLVSCVPVPVRDRPTSGVRSDFSIEPEGTWLIRCLDVASSAAGKAIVAHQMKVVFAAEEPTFTLSHSFLSQGCTDDQPEVALHRQIQGRIKLGEHADIDDSRRGRAVEVEISRDSYTPKTRTGLDYLRERLDDGVGSSPAVGEEMVIPENIRPYNKLYGTLAVAKAVRNAMHVYLGPQRKNIEDIVPHLNASNLYVRHITK